MRLFLLGDSFTDNLYDRDRDYDDHINKYLNKFEGSGIKPKWFSDHLESWGYEIHNLGIAGASNYDIMNRFARIDKKFREGDRIIINWSSFSRHNWLNESGGNQTVHNDARCIDDPYIRDFFIEQSIIREKSVLEGGFLATSFVPFLNYLVDLHSKYKPIIWAPFVNLEKTFENNKWFYWNISNPIFKDSIEHWDKLIIADEFPDLIDRHNGRYGNFYLAVLLRTILESGKEGYYTGDSDLLNQVFYNLKNSTIPDTLL
jgi:hypothetical protein